jgi:hypothetical protein
MALYEHYQLRKKHLTCQSVVNRAEARRNRHKFWHEAELAYREHQRWLKIGIMTCILVVAVLLWALAGR